jgi:pantetheine-phosphate adenylyltransferase
VIGSTRKQYMFDADTRVRLVSDAVAHLDNVRVEGFNMLVTEFARQTGACALVKGLRAISDFDYEFQMAQINKVLAHEIETVYLPASAKYSFISSSGVREIAVWGGSVEDWVPPNVVAAFRQIAGTHTEEE